MPATPKINISENAWRNSPKNWLVDIFGLTLFCALLCFIFLGSRPLYIPDEGRYAEIAREMLVDYDFITPHLNAIKYFEKPPLFYWLGSIAFYLGGINLWSIRSVNALLSIFCCLFTYICTRQLYDRNTALLSACILATSSLFFVMSHMVSLDLTLTFFMSACFYCFLLGVNAHKIKVSYIYAATLFAALAVLTKGLIGVLLPLLVIFLWMGITQQFFLLKQLPIFNSLCLFLILTLPWHVLVSYRNPEFPYFYFVKQQLLRYSTEQIGHLQPLWFFIPWLLLGFFPWSIFLLQVMRKNIKLIFKNNNNQIELQQLFFCLWVLVIFVFFSFSKSKLIPYILPLFPALAILTAQYLTEKHLLRIAIIMIASGAILFTISLSSLATLEKGNIFPLATTLKKYLRSEDEVITYKRYYHDLPFYIQKRITIVNWKNELAFGMQHQNTKEWMIDEATFFKRWQNNNRVFALMNKHDYEHLIPKLKGRFFLLGKTLNNVLVSNYPT